MKLVYEGGLHTTAVHGPSQANVETDAPVDNQGKGEAFSPTDLLATSLGSCMLTTMAIVGDRVDGTVDELGAYAAPLADLVAPAYFVTGNHEYYSDATGWVEFLPTLGVRVLRNEHEEIRRGDVIAWVGNTGRSTGPHLHYEVVVNGRPVDPELFILDVAIPKRRVRVLVDHIFVLAAGLGLRHSLRPGQRQCLRR